MLLLVFSVVGPILFGCVMLPCLTVVGTLLMPMMVLSVMRRRSRSILEMSIHMLFLAVVMVAGVVMTGPEVLLMIILSIRLLLVLTTIMMMMIMMMVLVLYTMARRGLRL